MMDCTLAESGADPAVMLVLLGLVAVAAGAVLMLTRRKARTLVRTAVVAGVVLVGAVVTVGAGVETAVAADCPTSSSPQHAQPAPAVSPSLEPTPSPELVVDGQVSALAAQVLDVPSGQYAMEYTGSLSPSAASTAPVPAGSIVEFSITNREFGGATGVVVG